MSTLIYDPDMTISVVDQSIQAAESETPALDTALGGLFAGFSSKGKHNVIYEAKSPADLMNTFGDDFGSFEKYDQANLTALGFARSGGRTFFCSLLPKDAKRAYSVFGVSVTEKSDIPVYERADTVYTADKTAVESFGTGAFVLNQSGDKIQCKVKNSAADETAEKLVVTTGVEVSVGTKTLEDTTSNFDTDGAPTNFNGEPIVTNNEGVTTTFYPLFVQYYYSNGKGGNDFAYTITRDTGRDKKLTDGRRYAITFFKLLSTGSYTSLYDEPFYFSFNPNAKYSEDSEVQEGLGKVYQNKDDNGTEVPVQMNVFESNYTKLVEALKPFKDPTESIYDIDFINGIFKNGNKYTKIVLAADSIDTANSMITLDNGTDGSLEVGNTIDGVVVTSEKVIQTKEALLQDFFNCNVDDDIFDEKITDIDYLFDCNYSLAVKKTILGTFSQYRPDIALRMDLGETTDYANAINVLNELTPYLYSAYNFMVSFCGQFGTLTDLSVGSPYRVSCNYDFARVEAENFASANGAFQMHAGANRGVVKYFRPDWIAKKAKSGYIEKLRDLNLNYIERLNKTGTLMYGSESTQYNKEGSKLSSVRNSIVIGRAMRICHGVLPYYKYDERNIEQTLKAAQQACVDALTSSNIPNTITIDVNMYQTKADKREENAHCDITFTFPDYAKSFTVTIIAKRPTVEE